MKSKLLLRLVAFASLMLRMQEAQEIPFGEDELRKLVTDASSIAKEGLEDNTFTDELLTTSITGHIHTRSPYVPGTPGAAWTKEEALIIKSKLWRILDKTTMQTWDLLKEIHGPGWEGGPFLYELAGTGRMAPAWIRLAFHGSFRETDGTGGADGCLWWDGTGRIFADYNNQWALPTNVTAVPSFNNGLGPPVRILEMMWKNASFPMGAPKLNVSMRDSGKSRSDLWAFAGIVATEYGLFTHNQVCKNKDFQWPTRYPDGLQTNSFWGKHCTQLEGEPNCAISVQPEDRMVFRTGRKDCVPTQLYKKTSADSCEKGVEIRTEAECEEAAGEQGVADFEFKQDPLQCASQAGETLCHWKVSEKYGHGTDGYYIDSPLGPPGTGDINPCREDLAPQGEAECKLAAEWMYLDYLGKISNVSGCHAIMGYPSTWHFIKIVLVYGDGPGPPPTNWKPSTPWTDARSVCRMPAERVDRYMAKLPGHPPEHTASGVQTVNWFHEEFGLGPRHAVALMGAHTMGRFHARQSLRRYIWVRNGGQMFNNEYFRNLAMKHDYRFLDDCTKIGDCYGDRPVGKWYMTYRGEQKDHGPIMWLLERFIAKLDCNTNKSSWPLQDVVAFNEQGCCSDLPEGAICKPNKKRAVGTDPIHLGYTKMDYDNSCEVLNTEGGNHDQALPAELGMYLKFEVNQSELHKDGRAYYTLDCHNGYENGWDPQDGKKNCGLQDAKIGDEPLKLYEIVELYAENNDLFVKNFNYALEKCIENGYTHDELTEIKDVGMTSGVICQTQHYVFNTNLKMESCFFKEDLSDPFVLLSETDQRHFQVNAATGALEMGEFRDPAILVDPKKVKDLPANVLWYTLKCEHGDRLINGILEYGVGHMMYNSSASYIRGYPGYPGYLGRNWLGSMPEVIYGGQPFQLESMQRWMKPLYFAEDQLSPPFVLVSESDLHILQVSEGNGSLEVQMTFAPEVLRDPSKVADLPLHTVWYIATTDSGDQLVNGLVHAPFGEIIYKASTKEILSGEGKLSRGQVGSYSVQFQHYTDSVASKQRWQKPKYFAPDALSAPFVLISDMDRRLLQINDVNGSWEMGAVPDPAVLRDPSKLASLDPKALWYVAETESGNQLINGLVHAALGDMAYDASSSHIETDVGYVMRNYPTVYPEVTVYPQLGSVKYLQRWIKSLFFTQEQLQGPFVLYSEYDLHLLQVSATTGALEVQKSWNTGVLQDGSKVAELPLEAQWYVAKTDDGDLLVSGLLHGSFGKFIWNATSGRISQVGDSQMYASRSGFAVSFAAESPDDPLQIFKRPLYNTPMANGPFVLISEMDKRMLQMNESNGVLFVGGKPDLAAYTNASYVKTMPKSLQWFGNWAVDGIESLSNGILQGAYRSWEYNESSGSLHTEAKGYVARNWAGSSPEVVYWKTKGGVDAMSKWLKPMYFDKEDLSPPFVLYSAMDMRLLQVNPESLTLEVQEAFEPAVFSNPDKVKELPSRAVWYTATTEDGEQLVSGLSHCSFGKLLYTASQISHSQGYVTRSGSWGVVFSADAPWDLAMWIWHKPSYVTDDRLSAPFVLISEMDQRLLKINESDGALIMGGMRDLRVFNDSSYVASLPASELWYFLDDGDQLVNGLVLDAFGTWRYNSSSFSIHSSGFVKGYLARNWAGSFPETVMWPSLEGGQKSMYRWKKPMHFQPEQLSSPFVLYNELDLRLLQMNETTGTLEAQEAWNPAVLQDPEKVKDLPLHALWHIAKTDDGDQLVNGLFHCPLGKLIYNSTSAQIFHDVSQGYASRSGDRGIAFWSTPSAAKWYKPTYLTAQELSDPFVLISEMDQRLLQVSEASGQLEMGQVRDNAVLIEASAVTKLPANAIWYEGGPNKMLVNGLAHCALGSWEYNASESTIHGAKGYLARNWAGLQPEVNTWKSTEGGIPSMYKWSKPEYLSADNLSVAFVLISKMDQRLLQVSASGRLEVGEVRPISVLKDPALVKTLNASARWHLSESGAGDKLVSSLVGTGAGKMTYNASSLFISSESGYVARNWAGVTPDIVYWASVGTASVLSMQQWLKPKYISAEQLSDPFVLFSEMDLHLLAVKEDDGSLQVQKLLQSAAFRDPERVKEVPLVAQWHVAKTDDGDLLVNGLWHCSYGTWTYNEPSSKILEGDSKGFLQRYGNYDVTVVADSADSSIQRWHKPAYHDYDSNAPFILISVMDQRMLQVNGSTGALVVSAARDLAVFNNSNYTKNVPSSLLWYFVTVKDKDQKQQPTSMLVNGLVHSALGTLEYNSSSFAVHGEGKGYVARNWAGSQPEVLFWSSLEGGVPSMYKWMKPMYFAPEQLSNPFVLYDESDLRLLQMNPEDGNLEVQAAWNPAVLQDPEQVKKLPSNAVWYIAKTESGDQLVNGLLHCPLGVLLYNSSSAQIFHALNQGYASRSGDRGIAYTNTGAKWLQPKYIDSTQMSTPFVLISEMDQRVLQVNVSTGQLEMGALRDEKIFSDPEYMKSMPSNAVWYSVLPASESGIELVSGLAHAALGNLKFDASDASIHGDKGYVARNWAGQFPEISIWPALGGNPSMHRWTKGECTPVDNLSPPFVLISKMDQRLLQVDDSDVLSVGEVRPIEVLSDPEHVKTLNKGAWWYLSDNGAGDQLLNGKVGSAAGKLTYDINTNFILGASGYMARNWAGVKPDIVTWADVGGPSVVSMQSWLKPQYFSPDTLSSPFVLYSSVDLRLIGVYETDGRLQMSQTWDSAVFRDPTKVEELPKNLVWYIAKTADGDQLINGLWHCSYHNGKFIYEEASARIFEFSTNKTVSKSGSNIILTETIYAGADKSLQSFHKPTYFNHKKSAPFVLISEMDQRMLQLNESTGTLDVGEVRDLAVFSNLSYVESLPARLVWYFVEHNADDAPEESQLPHNLLVNGLVHTACGALVYNESSTAILGEKGYVARNWAGVLPSVLYWNDLSGYHNMYSWQKPTLFADEQLSPEFILFSETDLRLLQVNEETGKLEMQETWDPKALRDPEEVKKLPRKSVWFVAKTPEGDQLVNGLSHCSFGKLIYDPDSAKILHAGDELYASRSGDVGIVFSASSGQALQRFHKPTYLGTDELSAPFVLISESDQKLLQVSDSDGALEMGAVRDINIFMSPDNIKDLPINTIWYFAEAHSHEVLVNGLTHVAINSLKYASSTSILHSTKGYVARGWAGELQFWAELAGDPAKYRWLKPTYVPDDKLSPPFVLISDMDQHLLQVNETSGALQIGDVRPTAVLQDPDSVTTLPKSQWWHLAETEYGNQLVNGFVRTGVGQLVYNESSSYILGEKGFLARNWGGATPDIVSWPSVGDVQVQHMQRWLKPIYFPADKLSAPSVLISEMDNRLLQVNADTSKLEMGSEWDPTIVQDLARVKQIPSEAMWQIAESADGTQLINGLLHYTGKLVYNGSSAYILGRMGYVSRNWPGYTPEVIYDETAHEGWRVSYQRFFQPGTYPEPVS